MTDQTASDGARKRRHVKFTLPTARPPERPPKVPKASEVELTAERVRHVPPSNILAKRLGSPALLIGVDIETHDWPEEENRGRIGQFGWYTVKGEKLLDFARIVQIGWAIGDARAAAPVSVKASIVQPDGFQISAKATKFHGISHATACKNGRPVADVLRDFMADVLEACSSGGRIVLHNLEFDAGIILNELARCGLSEMHGEWKVIAQRGFCTMDYEVGRWVRLCCGEEVGPPTAKHCLGLNDIVRRLLPKSDALMCERHDAGADAQLTRLVYIALLERAKLTMPTFDQIPCDSVGTLALSECDMDLQRVLYADSQLPSADIALWRIFCRAAAAAG